MSRTASPSALVVLGLAAFVAYLTLFTVSQTQQALVLEFGKPKRVITEPGLKYKIPFIQNVEFFDKRILDIDTAAQEVIASDKKRLVVDAFARYKIVDPLLFFQSLRDERIAQRAHRRDPRSLAPARARRLELHRRGARQARSA